MVLVRDPFAGAEVWPCVVRPRLLHLGLDIKAFVAMQWNVVLVTLGGFGGHYGLGK